MSMEHPEKQKNAVKSVVDQVMDGIISQIIDGTLHPGDKLPTEMELCKQFGAGRNSVREAVKKLQAYGILYIKRADGTFVSENYNQKMLDPMLYSIILQKNSWQEFVELRSVIDIGTLNIIIQRNDITSFLPDLYRTFGELSAEMHSPEPSVDKVLELDSRFHTQIANAAQNPMLATITEYITADAAQPSGDHPQGAGQGRRGDRAVRRAAPPAAQRDRAQAGGRDRRYSAGSLHLLEEVSIQASCLP